MTSGYDTEVFLVDFFFLFLRYGLAVWPSLYLNLLEIFLHLPPEYCYFRCAPPYHTLNDLLMRTEAESRKHCSVSKGSLE